MKTVSIWIFLLFCSERSLSQNSWASFNDSCLKQTKAFYTACKQLSSNRPISSQRVAIDLKLIKLINQLYNDSTFTLKMLSEQTADLKNRVLNLKKGLSKPTLEFNAHAEGNLRVSIRAVLENEVLKEKNIHLETKTKVLCDGDQMYVNALDFLYLDSLAREINFPLAVKPYQGSLDFMRSE